MAISDDEGDSWYASAPLIGFGNIQPTVLRRDNGSLLAFMRDNSDQNRICISESGDDGLTWGPVSRTSLPNPGSGIDGVRLANGHWILVHNDQADSRATLAVSVSTDEGRTWAHSRRIEDHNAGRFHYPAVIQGRDGTIHVIYSVFLPPAPGTPPGPDGKLPQFVNKSIRLASFAEEWVADGNRQPRVDSNPAP
jgi:predicted neuraminidase